MNYKNYVVGWFGILLGPFCGSILIVLILVYELMFTWAILLGSFILLGIFVPPWLLFKEGLHLKRELT